MPASNASNGPDAMQVSIKFSEMLRDMSVRLADLETRLAAVEGGKQQKPEEAKRETAEKAAIQEVAAAEEENDETIMEYAMGTTLWDMPLVLGLPQLGWGSSALLIVAIVLNSTVQIYITFILVRSGSFITPDLWEENKVQALSWRENEAHEYSSVDASLRSLAARVCNLDGSLSIATGQASLVGQISDYLSISMSDIPQSYSLTGDGPALCMVCVFLFVVVILKELRAMATSLMAALWLPRGPSRVEDGQFVAISLPRLCLFVLMAAVRTGVCVTVLVTGCMWLAYTTDQTDLILNAAALGFIMDLDELLYDTIAPAAAQRFADSLAPLRYKRSRCHLEAIIPSVAGITILVLLGAQVLIPNVKAMHEVASTMCGGNLNFAIEENPAGWVSLLGTDNTTSGSETQMPSLKVVAVREARNAVVTANMDPLAYSIVNPTVSLFAADSQHTLGSFAQNFECIDWDVALGGRAQRENPGMFMAIRVRSNRDRDQTVREKPFVCSEYADLCHQEGLMRLLCPITCGCTHPTSSLVLKTQEYGCPPSCKIILKEVLNQRPCTNLPVANQPNWTGWWRNYHDVVTQRSPVTTRTPAYQAFINERIASGCDNVQRDPLYEITFCDPDSLLKVMGVSTISGFCPDLCCGYYNYTDLSECPSSCPV